MMVRSTNDGQAPVRLGYICELVIEYRSLRNICLYRIDRVTGEDDQSNLNVAYLASRCGRNRVRSIDQGIHETGQTL